MTTIQQEHQFAVYLTGKSCRQLFYNACVDREMKCSASILKELSPHPNEYLMKEVNFDARHYLGPVGCDALFDLMRANKTLIRIVLRHQGVTDQVVFNLIQTVKGNLERVEELDLRDNKDITDESSIPLFDLLASNSMVSSILLDGTSIAKSIQRKITAFGQRNARLEGDFFEGGYIRLKKLFSELDKDNTNSISLTELFHYSELSHIPKLIERKFDSMDSTDASIQQDGVLQIDEFLFFIYPQYKPFRVLKRHMEMRDELDDLIAGNWSVLKQCFEERRIEFDAYEHLIIRSRLLQAEEAKRIVELGIQFEWKSTRPGKMTKDGRLYVDWSSFQKAIREVIGIEETDLNVKLGSAWGSVKIPPRFARLMYGRFRSHLPDGFRARPEMASVTIGTLLEDLPQSTTTTIQQDEFNQIMRKGGLGPNVKVTFSEWFNFVNEQWDNIASYIYTPEAKSTASTGMFFLSFGGGRLSLDMDQLSAVESPTLETPVS